MTSQREKAEAFLALHRQPGGFVIPNPWDVGSACILAGSGYKALATTSSGFAMTLGRADYRVTRAEKLAHCAALAAAVDVPISADLEDGFGRSPEIVAETITLAAATGIVGGSIEDYSGDPDSPILPLDEAVKRIEAAVAAARALDFPFVLTARAEALLHGERDLAPVIERLQAFEAAGADVLYAPGLRELPQVAEVVEAVSTPINVLCPFFREATFSDIFAAGATRISLGGALARAAAGEALRAIGEMRDEDTFSFVRRAARGELDDLMTLTPPGQ